MRELVSGTEAVPLDRPDRSWLVRLHAPPGASKVLQSMYALVSARWGKRLAKHRRRRAPVGIPLHQMAQMQRWKIFHHGRPLELNVDDLGHVPLENVAFDSAENRARLGKPCRHENFHNGSAGLLTRMSRCCRSIRLT